METMAKTHEEFTRERYLEWCEETRANSPGPNPEQEEELERLLAAEAEAEERRLYNETSHCEVTEMTSRAYNHGSRAGEQDCCARLDEVASGREADSWATPEGACEEWLNAAGIGRVERELGQSWDDVGAEWTRGFNDGYLGVYRSSNV